MQHFNRVGIVPQNTSHRWQNVIEEPTIRIYVRIDTTRKVAISLSDRGRLKFNAMLQASAHKRQSPCVVCISAIILSVKHPSDNGSSYLAPAHERPEQL